ncbi:TlpA family protein disulfide reductase [Sphingobacterium paludis]|uniref:AhpC/TSA family protein n=1 Tax=Sphingobacterium paludis TaxID=1476465 RepID=A0A4R7CQK4_9SPHI|nr:TlpA disulfide reductase family protein [Sphingobacterium paludis]TDS06815.1 AhpC/TSA family protein [Sphingobacterium paludis]
MRKSRTGECYALLASSENPLYKNIHITKFRTLQASAWVLTAIFCLLFSVLASAQSTAHQTSGNGPLDNKTLSVGDSVPEELWNMALEVVNHPSGKQTIKLGDFSNKKMIILDFWATWCVPCIRSLHHLDSIQHELKNELQIIPVSAQKKKTIVPFLSNRKISLISVVSDSLLIQYFPHLTVPHHVWIENGVVTAITHDAYSSRANISSRLKEQAVKTLPKHESTLSYLDSVPGNGLRPALLSGSFYPRIDRLAGSVSRGKSYIYAENATVERLLTLAFLHSSGLIGTKIIWDIDTALRKNLTGEEMELTGEVDADQAVMEWLENFQYCYLLKLADPPPHRSMLSKLMQDDVRRLIAYRYGLSAEIIQSEEGKRLRVFKEEGQQ